MAISFEKDKKVLHWPRPYSKKFDIQYLFEGQYHDYQFDLIIETEDRCYLVEVKDSRKMDDPDVFAKKDGVVKYCKIASDWCITNNYKPWTYLLIPHDVTRTTNTISYLADKFSIK